MNTLRRTLLFAVLLPFLAVAAAQDQFTGRVVGVTDGDTIEVMREGMAAKVRLHGIDSPESGQDYGTQAKLFTSEQAFGLTVTVAIRDTDRYGRLVGEVTLPNGKNLNHEIVRAGYAWWYQEYAKNDMTLARLHNQAVQKRVGLWASPKPAVAPWDFRRGKTNNAPEAPTYRPTPTIQTPTQPTYQPQRAQQQQAAPVYQQPAYQAPAQQQVQSANVYATKTGSKYHRAGCQYLAKSQIPVTLQQAQGRGLTACSRCRP